MTQGAETILTRAWLRRGLTATALWPLSLVFQLLSGARRRLYRSGTLRSERLPVPVIVAGNIFVGGTGKTPLTIWLVEELRRAGFTPGVISRGYGRKSDTPLEVMSDSSPNEAGDEPVLIAYRARCPVVVGRRRAEAAKALLARHPEVDVIVSDDGLQHYALYRDVEIVLCDERGNGNGWVLPAGPLREPPSRPRDFTVYNAARLPAGIPAQSFRMQLAGEVALPLSRSSPPVALQDLASSGKRTAAAAGIGNPARFFTMLRNAGLAFTEIPLADHYDFSSNPFDRIDADIILITEKDAVKCTRIDTINRDPRIWVVPVTARIDRALAERIVEKCRGRPTA
ncbi:tetraacyldisaccharide 4'-kinase [Herbaspirillum sp. HC18]|nr:tetraacyldisaccharide 4'-kinase [Herbaspirillum sp. HC18]